MPPTTTFRLFALLLVAVASLATPVAAQQPPAPPAARKPRVSPPQPQQAQGIDYVIGDWSFSWVGREARLPPAPAREC